MQAETVPTIPAYRKVVVALDGSRFAEGALPVADELCTLFDAGLQLVGFGVDADDEAELKARAVELTEGRADAEILTGVDWHPADALTELLGGESGTSLLCMASHARHGVLGALFGSVAADTLARWEHPVLLTGPAFAGVPIDKGPVVACVDGTAGARAALPAAAGWADRLGLELHIVTVAEPVLPATPGHHTYRHHGPADDVLGYVEGLAAMWRTESRTVEARAIYDPVGVTDALADYLADEHAALVVLASRPRGGAARAILGSTANEILAKSPAPVLVVPRLD